MFSVSVGRVYSSPTSCSCPPACLAKAGAFPSPPTTLHECWGCVKRITGSPFSPHAEQGAPGCASQWKTSVATEIAQCMIQGQPNAALGLAQSWTEQLAACTSCCCRQGGPLALLRHKHKPRAGPEPVQRLQHHKEHTPRCAITRVLSALQIPVPCSGVCPAFETPWTLI